MTNEPVFPSTSPPFFFTPVCGLFLVSCIFADIRIFFWSRRSSFLRSDPIDSVRNSASRFVLPNRYTPAVSGFISRSWKPTYDGEIFLLLVLPPMPATCRTRYHVVPLEPCQRNLKNTAADLTQGFFSHFLPFVVYLSSLHL